MRSSLERGFMHDLQDQARGQVGGRAIEGVLWIAWPTVVSEIVTDLNARIVRKLALKNSLTSVKVCKIDRQWSAMKFVLLARDEKQTAALQEE